MFIDRPFRTHFESNRLGKVENFLLRSTYFEIGPNYNAKYGFNSMLSIFCFVSILFFPLGICYYIELRAIFFEKFQREIRN